MYKATNYITEININTVFTNKIIPARHWLHSIRYMTANKLGTIFWKGVCIDVLKNSEDDVNKPYLLELSQRCRHLESINVPVNIKTVVFFWQWFRDMRINHPYKKVLSRCPDIRVAKDNILFTFDNAACENRGGEWTCLKVPSRNENVEWASLFYSDLKKKGYKGVPLIQSDLDGLVSCFNRYKVPTNLLEIMARSLNPRLSRI